MSHWLASCPILQRRLLVCQSHLLFPSFRASERWNVSRQPDEYRHPLSGCTCYQCPVMWRGASFSDALLLCSDSLSRGVRHSAGARAPPFHENTLSHTTICKSVPGKRRENEGDQLEPNRKTNYIGMHLSHCDNLLRLKDNTCVILSLSIVHSLPSPLDYCWWCLHTVSVFEIRVCFRTFRRSHLL